MAQKVAGRIKGSRNEPKGLADEAKIGLMDFFDAHHWLTISSRLTGRKNR